MPTTESELRELFEKISKRPVSVNNQSKLITPLSPPAPRPIGTSGKSRLVGQSPWENTKYNPEKAREYRKTFHLRDAAGRDWNKAHADYLKANPQVKLQNKRHTAKYRRIKKLKLKERLQRCGLPWNDTKDILRRLDIEQLSSLSELLDARNSSEKLRPEILFTLLQGNLLAHANADSNQLLQPVNSVTLDSPSLHP